VAEKMWSYKEITQVAEAKITALLKEAKQVPEKNMLLTYGRMGFTLDGTTSQWATKMQATRLD
jgi:hypothetical protein